MGTRNQTTPNATATTVATTGPVAILNSNNTVAVMVTARQTKPAMVRRFLR